jgi:hypothetical protein
MGKSTSMFGIFKKKDPNAAIMARYRSMLAESHRLSTVDRRASDLKRAEAEALLAELDRSGKK